jgi:hypothetical protein
MLPVIGMEDRCVEAAPSPLGRVEGVDDQVGAHVIGDHPAHQAA